MDDELTIDLDETLLPLEPLSCFELSIDVGSAPTLLPDLLNVQFAKVYLALEDRGLSLRLVINDPFDQPSWRGDCVELLIDTHDLKSMTITPFCHHFIILPELVDGEKVREVTRFRTEERHPIARPDQFEIVSRREGRKRHLEIFISKEALHGYDLTRNGRLGFNYRVVGASGQTQCLTASWVDCPVEQHPVLWATVNREG